MKARIRMSEHLGVTIKTWQENIKWRVKVIPKLGKGKLNYTSLREFDTQLEAVERAKIFIALYFKSKNEDE